MTYKPYAFQEKDLAKLREHNYTGLLAIQPGGGKTATALFSARDSGASQTLIVAPKSTFNTAWKSTTPNIMGVEARVIGNGVKDQRAAMSDLEWGVPGVYLTSPQLFTVSDISMWKPDLLVVDEVHQLNKAGGKGQRKLSGFSAKDDPISKQVGASLSLSGTPARSSFERMWAICRLHWPELYSRGEVAYDNQYSWLLDRMTSEEIPTAFEWVPCTWSEYRSRGEVYGKVIQGIPHLGKTTRTNKKWLLEKEPGRLFSEMPCVIQHFRREQCCEFHPNGFLDMEKPNEVERVVELAPSQKRIIKELEDQGLTWIEDNPFVVDLPMTLQQRIRQVCLAEPTLEYTGELDEYGIPKTTLNYPEDFKSSFFEETLNILDQLGDEPVVIYLSSQRFAHVLTKRLIAAGISAFEYSGKTSKSREEDLKGFGSEFRVLVGIVSAIGTGTDGLQHVCNNEIWLEVPVDDVDTQQAQGRLDRLGADKQVQRFWIHDDLGYSQGMFSTKLAKRLEVARSTRLEV